MINYILVYEISDYPENGGGYDYMTFENIQDMEDQVNRLNTQHEDRFSIKIAAEVKSEITFKPVEIITRLQADI